MKHIPLLSLALAVGMSGCVETAPDDAAVTFIPVTDAATFNAAVVGKKLVNVNDPDSRFFRLNADGTTSGNYGNGPLAGTWRFENGTWCRTWTAGLKAESLNKRECQLVEIAGDRVALTRDRGAGNRGEFLLR